MADMEQNSTKQCEIDYLRSLIEGLKRELAAKSLAYEGLSGIKDGAFRALEQWQKRAEQLEALLRRAKAYLSPYVQSERELIIDIDAALAGGKDADGLR